MLSEKSVIRDNANRHFFTAVTMRRSKDATLSYMAGARFSRLKFFRFFKNSLNKNFLTKNKVLNFLN
jgi:hypothetical protein